MKIGVFDSGVGGLSFVKAINKALPKLEVEFANDVTHLPYGSKTPEEILNLATPILQKLSSDGCSVIVVACNTVSTTVINILRQKLKTPLIAVEPMVKPASEQTKTGVIAVCATPATLKSARYRWLKSEFAKNIVVLEPDCSDWAYMIEHKLIDKEIIQSRIEEVLDKKADVIVLGCTHYHWIEDEIKTIASSRAVVIQPEQAVIRELKRVIAQLH